MCSSLLAIAFVCGSCGVLGGPGGPGHAHSLVYEARYADYGIHATAQVAYTAANGKVVYESVTLPWQSHRIAVRAGTNYRVTLVAPSSAHSNTWCGVQTNNGWDMGDAPSGGNCDYTFNTKRVP